MKNSMFAFLLMLPMLCLGQTINQPVKLTVFYKQRAVVHESQRVSSVT